MDRKPALVVIDLQKGVVSIPMAHSLNEIVERTASLAAAFRWHDLPAVRVPVTGRAPGRTACGPHGCTPSPDWADLVPELDAQSTDFRVTKNRVGAFSGTSLDAALKGLGVTPIVLASVATTMGIESTARVAHDHG
jgi:nicotinamidase-related amidase